MLALVKACFGDLGRFESLQVSHASQQARFQVQQALRVDKSARHLHSSMFHQTRAQTPSRKPQAANPQTRNVAFLALRAVFQMFSPSRFKQLGWIVVFKHLAVFSNAVGG